MDNTYNSSLYKGSDVQSTSEMPGSVQSECNEKSTSNQISNINMTDFLDPSNRDMNPKEETRFHNMKLNTFATTQKEFDQRLKSNTSASKSNCNLNPTINSNTAYQNLNENNNAVIKDKMPAKVTLAKQSVLIGDRILKTSDPAVGSKKNQPFKVSRGVQKKKSKCAKRRAKTLRALSEMHNMCLPVPEKTVNAHNSTKCRIQTDSASEKASQSLSNSTSVQRATSSTAEDATSKRRFIKAKRNFDKEKQFSAFLEGESSMKEINDRVQRVCRRWNVESLSSQDINLTTSAYARQYLSAQELTSFQGCLEGQKDYTLAIVAPTRKRRRNEYDDSETFADYSLEHATKKRRLSRDVQLIAGPVKDVHPDLKLFSDQMIEMLSASQKMALSGLNTKKKKELEQVNQLYSRLRFQLREKQYEEEQYYYYNQDYYGPASLTRLQYEHNFQWNILNFRLQEQLRNIETTFLQQENKLRSQYKTSIEKIKSESTSDHLTVALRKGPDYTTHYKTTYQTVTLTPHIALAMVKEDEIYDSFYSHKA